MTNRITISLNMVKKYQYNLIIDKTDIPSSLSKSHLLRIKAIITLKAFEK